MEVRKGRKYNGERTSSVHAREEVGNENEGQTWEVWDKEVHGRRE